MSGSSGIAKEYRANRLTRHGAAGSFRFRPSRSTRRCPVSVPLLLRTPLLQVGATPVTDTSVVAGARQPAFASDGRLAVSIRGDIWIIPSLGSWQRVTTGGASDREPAWSADGSYIVFSSDRSGKLDLWQVGLGADAQRGTKLTKSDQPDAQPTVAPDGSIVFARGRGAGAQLWRRAPNGTESRLTGNAVTERSPVISPDGRRLAYVALDESGRALRIRALDGSEDTVVLRDRGSIASLGRRR